MAKLVTTADILAYFHDGMTVSIGGFLAAGTPELLIDKLVASQVTALTVIGNDTGFPDKGIGKLVVNHQVKRVIASHIGTNPETGKQMNSGQLTVDLVPQGTLAEQLRCGGAGLGGVLTATGLGTVVAEGKQVITVAGKDYLLETPLRADVALIKAAVADKSGNLVCRRASANFNPVMAMAADLVIAEVDCLVETGDIDPDHVTIPGIMVDYIVVAKKGE